MRTLSLTLLLQLLVLCLLPGCQRSDVIEIVGTLERDRIELVAESSEPLVAINVQEGMTVTAGQVILTLDERRARAQLDQARALFNQQQARLAELLRGPRSEQLEQARAQLAGAGATLDNARLELRRTGPLVEKQLLSPQDLDTARTAVTTATAARDAARARLDELEHGTTREELEQAQAAQDAAAATVRTLEISVQRLTVRAPVDGVIDDLPLEVGEQPQAGAVVAVMLSGTAPYARIYLPEPLRTRIRPGSPATVRVDGIETPFHGQVRRISADPAFTPYFSLTRNDRSRLAYLTEVELDSETAHKLPSGVPLQVTFDADRPAD